MEVIQTMEKAAPLSIHTQTMNRGIACVYSSIGNFFTFPYVIRSVICIRLSLPSCVSFASNRWFINSSDEEWEECLRENFVDAFNI